MSDPENRIVVSIPYSGTRYLRQTLSTPKCVHTYVPPERLWEYAQEAQYFLVPLRRPEAVWASWARRWPLGKPWDKRIAEFERAWMGMAWFLDLMNQEIPNIYVIPLDAPSDITIREVAAQIGVEIQPAEKIGQEDEGENSYDYDVSHLYKYNFVKQYYGENK